MLAGWPHLTLPYSSLGRSCATGVSELRGKRRTTSSVVLRSAAHNSRSGCGVGSPSQELHLLFGCRLLNRLLCISHGVLSSSYFFFLGVGLLAAAAGFGLLALDFGLGRDLAMTLLLLALGYTAS